MIESGVFLTILILMNQVIVFSRYLFPQIYPTSTSALVKSNDMSVLVYSEMAPEQPFKLKKLLLTQPELNILMGNILNEVQSCQQALNDENDKRDMYKVMVTVVSIAYTYMVC